MATNAELQALRESAVPQGVSTMHPVFADRALNSEIWDVEGKRYIDFAGGIAVVNTGHNHPKVMEAVKDQLDKFSHTCFQVTPYDSYLQLAEKINEAAPGDTPKKTIFLTTGAEAVENAVKIARAYTKRTAIISFSGGFHGRTNFAMALTGKVVPYKAGFGPFAPEVFHVPYPASYLGVTEEDALKGLDRLFAADVEPSRVAAIIIEPVQGEGGFYVASPQFLQALRAKCDDHGILLVCDEIQTGFARTGKLFATEYAGIEPDLMTMAKGIAGGFPISAVCGKAEIMDAPGPGGLGGTYGGSPMGCAAGNAVMQVIEDENLCERAVEIGDLMVSRLQELADKNTTGGSIGEIRNLGAMVAMELVKDGDASLPDPEFTKAIVVEAQKRGLILLSCGVRGNVVRFLVPLTASDDLINEGMDVLGESFEAAKT